VGAGPIVRPPFAEVGRADLDVLLPIGGDHVLGRDGVDRAGLYAGVAVDALLGIDVELLGLPEVGLVGPRVNAVDGQTSTQLVSFMPMQGSLIT
jgi:hypothetical protein